MPSLNPNHLLRYCDRLQWNGYGCLLWTGERNEKGYGRASIDGKMHSIHRLFFETFIGPIPKDKVLDHLCRQRNCANPNHLRIVTNKENILCGVSPSAVAARKTHCPKGHWFAGDNLIVTKLNCRRCRICERERHAKQRVQFYDKRKAYFKQYREAKRKERQDAMS